MRRFAVLANAMEIQLQLPELYIFDLLGTTFSAYMIMFLPVIIPVGLFNLLGYLSMAAIFSGLWILQKGERRD